MVQQFGLDDEQWAALKAGPMHMLTQVGGADFHIDGDEWNALIAAVTESADADDELLRAVMASVASELKDGVAGPGQLSSDGLEGLRAIAAILDSREDRGRTFREALLELGATIAESSGSQLTRTFTANHGRAGWARSAGTSAMERAALEAAAEVLGLS